MKYRVKIALRAVYRKRDGTSELVELEPGSVFTVRRHVHSNMVIIVQDRRLLFVFWRDVNDRCEPVANVAPALTELADSDLE